MSASVSFHFGRVIHHRYQPDNRFSYPVFYLRIPMRTRKRQPDLLTKVGIGDNRFSILSFFDKDHGIDQLQSLPWIEHLLAEQQIDQADGEIWLHTFPRFLGYVFNPVSFWFCHDQQGALIAIVAEVNNTFGDRQAYLLQDDQKSLPWGKTFEQNKSFYVSPFFAVTGRYQFRFMRQTMAAFPRQVSRIEYFEKDTCALMTSISGEEYPVNRSTKLKAILSFPLLTFSIIAKIHWQALKLWIKGATFYKKPASSNV